MKELCIEGVATHDDPESCVSARKGVGEALTGAHVGRAIEPRNSPSGVPRRLNTSKATPPAALRRELPGDPARSENLCMRGISMRENREVPCPPRRPITGRGHREKAKAARLG
jgi:hypothetical protein